MEAEEMPHQQPSNTNLTQRYTPITPDQIEQNKHIFDAYDIDFVKNINERLFNIVEKSYFRPEFIGFDEMPERNQEKHPLILASNHSGMAFPWDAMVFGCSMFRRFNYDPQKMFRALVAPPLSGIPAMHPYFMKGVWKLSGGVDATFLNFETMMQLPSGHLLIYPEGVPGIGKGFDKRYQLQRFASSFIRMSLKYKTDIIPFSTVNAEWVAPFSFTSKRVNALFNKIGVPFFPLGVLTIFLIFPWAFYLAFPSKMFYVKGRRISPWKWTDKSYEDLTSEEINQIRDKVRSEMQEDLNRARDTYGRKPYHMIELIQTIWKNKAYFPYQIPIFWPFLFHEFQRQWIDQKKYITKEEVHIDTSWGSMLKYMFKNPITIAYFIPILGWIILIIYGNKRWKKLDPFGKHYEHES